MREAIGDIKKGIRRFYAIYGLRKVGKTSLLMELARRLENEPKIVTVIFDCSSNVVEGNIFFEELATQIIDRFLIQGGFFRQTGLLAASRLDEGEFLATLGKAQNVGSQALTEGIKALLKSRGKREGDREAFKTIVALPHKLHLETGKYFLVIMDEFQACSQLNSFSSIKRTAGEFFAFLRSFWRLREFPAADARQMVGDLFRRSGYVLRQAQMDLLIEIANCHPFYLQVLGEEICKASARKKVAPVTFKESLQDTLFSSTGICVIRVT